jgi:hypothetical protein
MKINIAAIIVAGILLLTSGVMAARMAPTEDDTQYLPIVRVMPVGDSSHDTITSYDGPETCISCHQNEAEQMHASVHYQQSGPTPNVLNIPGNAGKSDGAFNTYCGTIETSRFATCAGCHVGYGQKPSTEMSREQLNNIDCLMCHQQNYARKAAGPYEDISAIGPDGQPRFIQAPIEDENGFHYMPDESKMSITILEAARTVHKTNRATCLRCHAYASGSNGGKRGDLSSVTINPPLSSDVHMSPAGEDFTCAECHDAGDHRVRGRGLDLRPNDVALRFTCAHCHGEQPHDDYSTRNSSSKDLHAERVACQSCHIPTFAKDVSTEVERDWLEPFYSTAACSGQGGWKPEEIRQSNVVPTYRWFDGTSNVYKLGQVADLNPDGEYKLGAPNGSVSLTGAKIYPMKEHRSISARHDASGQMIPHSTFTYFISGDFDQAVREGMIQAGLSGDYTIVPVHTYQTINHGVERDDNALKCGQCHNEPEYSDGPLRMNLLEDLGYELKGSENFVCSQCHSLEDTDGFDDIHEEHVEDKGYDCSWCHNFSRPQRKLRQP